MSDFTIRVYYEDTDCGGIVYHTNYLKYCERARSEIFFANHSTPHTESIGLVVRHIEADFLDSARLGDLLHIQSEIIKLGKSSVVLKQDIYKESEIIFRAMVKLACIEVKTKKIMKIPDEILAILQKDI